MTIAVKAAAIVCKPDKPELNQIVPELCDWLAKREYHVYLDEESAKYMPGAEGVGRDQIADHQPAFAVVLGGDGTLLSAGRAVARRGVPIIGVNLGSLGFLTEVPLNEMYRTLEAVHQGCCPVEKRSMLHCRLRRNDKVIAEYNALNDAVMNKSAIARLISLDLYIDGVFISNYKADGVIIATPTGSTAYSLAAGGPVLMPSVDGFLVTPVSPHSLTHRPLVVRDTVEVKMVCREVEQQAFLSIDGQVGTPVFNGDHVLCRKSEHHVQLFRMERTFFQALRNKLKWGQRE